jgi:ABC-2 type transport system permease protein
MSIATYTKVFTLGLQEQMEYRFNTFVESVVGLGSFVVIFFLWSSIYAANGGRPIGGVSFPGMLTYLLLSRLWDWVQSPGAEVDTMLPEDIRNGGLSKILARPLNDRFYRLCLYLSHRLFSGAVRVLPVAAVMCLLPRLFSLAPGSGLKFLPIVMLLSLLLQFTFSYAVALTAFWFLRISGLLFLKRIVVSFLSGAWIPLMLFPPGVQDLSALLPFQYMVFFPVRLMIGGMPAAAMTFGCLVMSAWIVAFWALGVLLWKKGLLHYSGAGI